MNRMPGIFASHRLGRLGAVAGAGLLQSGSVIAAALVIRELMTLWLAPETGDTLLSQWPLLGVLLGLALIGAFCRWAERVNAEHLGQDYVHELRLQMFDALALAAPNSNHNSDGVHMVRFSNDLSAVRNWVSLGLARCISASIFIVGIVSATALISLQVAFAMVPLLLVSIVGLLLLGARLEKTVRHTRQRRGRLANTVAEQVVNLQNLTAHGRVAKERGRLEQRSQALGEALLTRAFWIGCLRAATELAQKIIMIVVLVVSARAVVSGLMDPASLIALVTVSALLATPLRDLGRVTEYWKNARVARRKISELLEPLAVPPVTLKKLSSGDGELMVKNLEIAGMLTLAELHVPAGQRVAISGENGAGKSTLLKVFAGLVTPARGTVRLDGIATNRLSPVDRRRAIGFAGQQMPLIAGSVSKNIRYRLPGADTEQVDYASRLAGLADLLDGLPRGLNTRIGGRRKLSAGEQARVMLARAIIGSPRLLLFDEIDANLDAAGRQAMLVLLRTYPGTVIFASHDPDLIKQADLCCTLRDGVVVVSNSGQPQLDEAMVG